jgi:hypothetical protein
LEDLHGDTFPLIRRRFQVVLPLAYFVFNVMEAINKAWSTFNVDAEDESSRMIFEASKSY